MKSRRLGEGPECPKCKEFTKIHTLTSELCMCPKCEEAYYTYDLEDGRTPS